MPAPSVPLLVGRYALYDVLAAGGMGSVHLGRLLGAAGFARTVAIKRLHPQLARDQEFAAMLLDEARLVARIHHPNVVPTLDVVAQDGELFLVMEYVVGESLAALIRARIADQPMPIGAAVAIVSGALAGLHAAHEARNERGEPLLIVHRDVSPQNILVGQDGVPRVLDFGIAKAIGRCQQTGQGVIKGKLGYMPPEQVRAEAVDRRADIYAAGIVLWEALTSRRLFRADSDWATAQRIFSGMREPPSLYRPEVPQALDDILLKACHVDPAGRFATAEEFAAALDDLKLGATPREIRDLVTRSVGQRLAERAACVSAMEKASLSEPSLATSDVTPTHLVAVASPPSGDAPPVITSEPAIVDRASITSVQGKVEPSRPRRALALALAGLALVLVVAAALGRTPAGPAPSAAITPTAVTSAASGVGAVDAATSAPAPAPSSGVPPPAITASAPAPVPRASVARPRPRDVFDNRH